jgi:hypothetical protein
MPATIQPTPPDDKHIAELPTIRSLDTRLALLTRLVTKIDDRQQDVVRDLTALHERLQHIIDQNERIIAALLPPGA